MRRTMHLSNEKNITNAKKFFLRRTIPYKSLKNKCFQNISHPLEYDFNVLYYKYQRY